MGHRNDLTHEEVKYLQRLLEDYGDESFDEWRVLTEKLREMEHRLRPLCHDIIYDLRPIDERVVDVIINRDLLHHDQVERYVERAATFLKVKRTQVRHRMLTKRELETLHYPNVPVVRVSIYDKEVKQTARLMKEKGMSKADLLKIMEDL